MPERPTLSTELNIKIDGSKIQDRVRSLVLEVTIDQHVLMPDMFTLRLEDADLQILDNGPFDLTKEIEIAAGDASNECTVLIKGEITALEPYYGEGMTSQLVVRGYDKSHRLFRETKSRAFLNKKDSQLAEEIAGEIGLSAQVESTSTVYDHIFQSNQSDLAFLMERAWRIGYECFVDDGKLYFRKPPDNPPSVKLSWGAELISFRPRLTLAEQVDEVMVKGWDADQQKAIVGKSQNGKLYPKIDESKNGAEWAGRFGQGKLIIVDQPVVSQAEADALAAARMNEVSGAFVQADGIAFRRPDIKAGKMVELELLGNRLSGKYLVTNAAHVYTAEGFRTYFSVHGSRTGSLAERVRDQKPLHRWQGVVTAVVTNSDDPNNWGRVKVKFPWLTDDAESDWARVVGAGAGPKAGFCNTPDVDDEVLVAFEHGDFSRPFVLGGMWNGQHDLPDMVNGAAQNERPLVRTWHSRTGHAITMYDNSDNKIEIKTAGGHTVNLDDAGNTIEIKSSSGLTITMDGGGSKIVIDSGGDVEIKSSANMKLESGANMDIKAGGVLNLEASGPANLKGAVVNLN
ncbi:MAG: VgrG-related protein [Chloroflexota bacterium]